MVCKSIAGLLCGLVHGIYKVLEVRKGADPTAENQVGPCVPRGLCRIRVSKFCDLIQLQKGRLSDVG